MRRTISLFCCSVIALVLFGGSAAAAEPPSVNLLVGTKYEHLIAEVQKSPVASVTDKGFLPNFGNYFDDANPGWGLDIQRLGNFIFAVWFTYDLDGTPTWFIIVGELDGMSVTGNIESFKWDRFGDPGEQATASVRGTMTIVWSNASDATASWTLDGESGSAPVSFAQFGLSPTLANMTGHYYDVMRPGWGYTLLTQGIVTVMTMYWYSGGQPVWAQAVSTEMGFNQIFELLYFLGPGLCPSCLSKNGDKGFTTQNLASLTIDWAATTMPAGGGAVTAAPISYIYETMGVFSAKGGPLGPNPFEDIFIPNTTQAITSVFQDNYDPEYEWFFDLLPNKGNDCLPFQYDPGIVDFPAELTGLSGTAYIGTDEADGAGRLRVYSDPDCTTRFTFPTFNGPGETSMLMAPTLQSGVVVIWKATFPPPPGKGSGSEGVNDEVRVLMAGGLFSTPLGLAMCMYGVATSQYFAIYEALALIFVFYSVFPPIIFPPQLAAILSDPCTAATVMLILLAASG